MFIQSDEGDSYSGAGYESIHGSQTVKYGR